jgi:hypothetical protein
MRDHDFVSDGFLALIAVGLCCCSRACSLSHLASLHYDLLHHADVGMHHRAALLDLHHQGLSRRLPLREAFGLGKQRILSST